MLCVRARHRGQNTPKRGEQRTPKGTALMAARASVRAKAVLVRKNRGMGPHLKRDRGTLSAVGSEASLGLMGVKWSPAPSCWGIVPGTWTHIAGVSRISGNSFWGTGGGMSEGL